MYVFANDVEDAETGFDDGIESFDDYDADEDYTVKRIASEKDVPKDEREYDVYDYNGDLLGDNDFDMDVQQLLELKKQLA
jgi:hypothetical protein